MSLTFHWFLPTNGEATAVMSSSAATATGHRSRR
ncbi:hypothetical protein QFZ58_000054 [Streptomyces sp. B1I3]|nr:hypothetical protein [Streptomyces sp. B1I3]